MEQPVSLALIGSALFILGALLAFAFQQWRNSTLEYSVWVVIFIDNGYFFARESYSDKSSSLNYDTGIAIEAVNITHGRNIECWSSEIQVLESYWSGFTRFN